MNYEVTWNNLTTPDRQQLSDVIKNADQEDTFLFITVKDPYSDPSFRAWVEGNELKDLIAFQMPDFIINGSHAEYGRRLKLYVFSKSAIKEAPYGTGNFTCGQTSTT